MSNIHVGRSTNGMALADALAKQEVDIVSDFSVAS